MKVIIAAKKEQPFKKLFVKTEDKAMFDKIVAKLKKDGAEDDKIEKFIKENEYNGKVSYPFDLMCSRYTWEAVEKYAELDVKIEFSINDKGYPAAKIAIEDKIEQVLGYKTSDSDNVTGWACGAAPIRPAEILPTTPPQTAAANGEGDLPF
jgi:hypothetical protein